ncbi:MAG: ROK family protein [Solirubrobacteraceae bacterium]
MSTSTETTPRGASRTTDKARRIQGPIRGGLDLGGTKIEAIVVDRRNRVLGSARRPTPTSGGPPDVAAELARGVVEACSEAGIEPAALSGVGIGSPGSVDPQTGAVANARNLPGWQDSFPLAESLSSKLGTRVHVGNDVQVATAAEFKLGAGKPYRSLLGVFWGTGVGGGLILDRRPWLGRGAAGEIGHTVIRAGGRRCACGRRGHVEAYAGRGAMEARARKLAKKGERTDLFELMKKRGHSRLTSSIWAHAIDHGDKVATLLIDEAIEALGIGIASAINLLDLEAVIIGGGLGVRFGAPAVERIAQAMLPQLFNDWRPPAVHLAALGDLGGALGAALLVPARGRKNLDGGSAHQR